MFRSKKEKTQMQRKIILISTVFLTILLFLGVPFTKATETPFSINIPSIKSIEPLEETINFSVNDILPARPVLSVEKSINASSVQPNKEWIKVNVTIKNIGNRTAFNLTIMDPSFSSWAVSSLNITEQDYVQVDINATIFYFYYIQTFLEGNFTLEATEVTYYNATDSDYEAGDKYHAKSQRFNIISIEITSIQPIQTELWSKILYYCIGVSSGIGAIVLADYLILKRPFQQSKRRKKTQRKETIQPKSKKQERRKVQKRRK